MEQDEDRCLLRGPREALGLWGCPHALEADKNRVEADFALASEAA